MANKRSKNKQLAEFMVESLRNPKEASSFVESALEAYEEDGNLGAFLQSLRYVSEAQGGVSEVSRRTGLNRQSLYKMLAAKGNPELKSILIIMRSLGMRLRVDYASC